MSTLLLSLTCRPDADALARAAQAAHWRVQWFDRGNLPPRRHDANFAYYGETDLGLVLSRRFEIALIEPRLDLLAKLPIDFTKRQVEFMSLGRALELHHRVFVKPADCTHKAFDADVWEAGKYIRCSDNLSRDTPVLASEPVSWTVEYRVIVVERNVVALSPYVREGWRACNAQRQWPYPEAEAAEMLVICRRLLDDATIKLPPAFTLDVGLIDQRGWAVVEFNPVWCSGMLGCDPGRMLLAIQRACRRKAQLSAEDATWVVDRGPYRA